jgi:hypothetical protein
MPARRATGYVHALDATTGRQLHADARSKLHSQAFGHRRATIVRKRARVIAGTRNERCASPQRALGHQPLQGGTGIGLVPSRQVANLQPLAGLETSCAGPARIF